MTETKYDINLKIKNTITVDVDEEEEKEEQRRGVQFARKPFYNVNRPQSINNAISSSH